MRKFLKTFDNHSQYDDFTGTTEFILPNVSLCVYEDDVHYNPVIKVNGVTLNNTELNLIQGNTDTLVVSVLPYNAINKNVIWSSSDDNVATVDNNGVVSGISVGNATITVTTVDGGFTAQCATSVKSSRIITYTATAKLPETTTVDYPGIHTKAFSGTTGQKLGFSHDFSNGIGKITFGSNLGMIGDNAFYECSGMTSINIPYTVTYIGGASFKLCSGLTSIVIPDSVTRIGYQAFQNCYSLTSCTIGSSVTNIGTAAFYNTNGLRNLTVKAIIPPSLSSNNSFGSNCQIYVPSDSVDTYKAASGWSSYSSRIQAIT